MSNASSILLPWPSSYTHTHKQLLLHYIPKETIDFLVLYISLTAINTRYIQNAQAGQNDGPIHAPINITLCHPYCLWSGGIPKHKYCVSRWWVLECATKNKYNQLCSLRNIRILMYSIDFYFVLLLKDEHVVLFPHLYLSTFRTRYFYSS
jgi:hypothetical protein